MHKGWFKVAGVQNGDRTIEQQLMGLEEVADHFHGKTVLDLGCAEGLIGRHCVDAWGAAFVDGVTKVDYEIAAAEKLCGGRPQRFIQGNLASKVGRCALSTVLATQYDIVLLLSVLHKAQQPMPLLEWAVPFARELIVIRLPAPVIDMERCRPGIHPVHPWMLERFDLVAEPVTCIEPVSGKPEWMGIYQVRELSDDESSFINTARFGGMGHCV